MEPSRDNPPAVIATYRTASVSVVLNGESTPCASAGSPLWTAEVICSAEVARRKKARRYLVAPEGRKKSGCFDQMRAENGWIGTNAAMPRAFSPQRVNCCGAGAAALQV